MTLSTFSDNALNELKIIRNSGLLSNIFNRKTIQMSKFNNLDISNCPEILYESAYPADKKDENKSNQINKRNFYLIPILDEN